MSEQEKDNNTAGSAGTGGEDKQPAPKAENPPADKTPADAPVAAKPAAPKPAAPKPPAPPRPAPKKNPAEDELRAKFGDKVELKYGIFDLEVHLTPRDLIDVCEFLKNRQGGGYVFLRNMTAVDWKDAGAVELIYHACEFPDTAATICIKCRVARDAAIAPSVTGIWPAAEWLEREVFDLFGVEFNGHPDLRRIMLPPEWEGHPLRKDYVHKEPALPPNSISLKKK
jgi:NADH-quinone oxidoreductase subunit C